ncbi:MAG: NifU family protein [Rhizobiales bacterium]|nr:NifU family protein [Hyphomicrobiales bacterium]
MGEPQLKIPPNASLDELLSDIARLESVFDQWDENQKSAVENYRKSVDDLHREAFRRFIASVKSDPAAMAGLKSALGDEIVYAVLRHFELIRPSLQERVEEALDSIRPMLASHGGDVELVAVRPPDQVDVRFIGACDGCPASMLTFTAGVKKAIETHCPEITKIAQIRGLADPSAANGGVQFVSPFAVSQTGGWLEAGALADIPEGGVLKLKIASENVLLSKNGDIVSCFQNACAHLNLPLDEGEIVGGILTCPHHGFQYDLQSGECLTAPEVQLQPHAVRVINGLVEVRLAT